MPKVSQDWHPRKSSSSPEEDEGETCIICMESVPPDHALPSCGQGQLSARFTLLRRGHALLAERIPGRGPHGALPHHLPGL